MGWLQRWEERHHVRWLAGEIDDATYTRKQVRAMWKVFGLVFGVIVVLVMSGLASEGKPLAHVLAAGGIFALVGLAIALRVGHSAACGVKVAILRRDRERAEADPAAPLMQSTHAQAPAKAPTIARFRGAHRRSNRFIHSLMIRIAAMGALALALYWWDGFSPLVALFASGVTALALASVYMRLDRRPFLDISKDGIWCRGWGSERFGFGDFKAVYPRQSRWAHGIALVPRDREQLRRRLSWSGRIELRNGGGGWDGSAHVGTITLWTNRVDLPQAELLRAIQAEIVARGSGEARSDR